MMSITSEYICKNEYASESERGLISEFSFKLKTHYFVQKNRWYISQDSNRYIYPRFLRNLIRVQDNFLPSEANDSPFTANPPSQK